MWRTLIVSLALICLVLLGWYAVRKYPGRIESDLQQHVQQAMAGRVPGVVVRASQRDIVLTGSVISNAERVSAETFAMQLSGVRNVVNQLFVRPEGAGAPANELPPPQEEAPADAVAPTEADAHVATDPDPHDVAGANAQDAGAVLEMDALEPDEPELDAGTLAPDATPEAPIDAEAAKAPNDPNDPSDPPAPVDAPTPPTGTLTAAQCKAGVTAAVEGENRIQFVGATGKLTPEGEEKLDEVWSILSRCPEAKGVIEAYHDDYGDPDKLKTLTQVRAYNVHNRLVQKGMADKRFRYVGLGYRNMRYGGGAKRVLNQRVEFNITVE